MLVSHHTVSVTRILGTRNSGFQRDAAPYSIASAYSRILFFVIAGQLGALALGHESLVVEPPQINFGEITRNDGHDKVLDATVRNDGSEQLEIRKIQVSCGCVSAELVGENHILLPGGQALIRLRLRVNVMRPGPSSYEILIFGAEKVLATSSVMYTYSPMVTSSPIELRMSRNVDGDYNAEATVSTKTSALTAELAARVTGRGLVAQLDKDPLSPNKLKLLVRATEDRPYGPIEETVALFRRESPDEPELVLHVRGARQPPVAVEPDFVLINGAQNDGRLSRTLAFKSDAAFHVSGISTEGGGLHAEVDDHGSSCRVIIVPREVPAGFVDGKVIVAFDAPTTFEITIPVVGELR